MENFRPGAIARLGLGYEAVAKINPQVVYCSISGFGQSGPMSDRAAYAPVAHAVSGVDMMLSRQIDPDAPPLDNRLMIADVQAGHHAFAAIQTALVHRLRHGVGSHVDVTMAEGMMGLVGMQFQQTQGGVDYSTSGFPWFQTLDGYVNIPLVSPSTFRLACKVIGRDAWAADPAYASFAGMAAHREEIRAAISAWTAARTSEDCDATMNAAGAPCAIYYMPDERCWSIRTSWRGAPSPRSRRRRAASRCSIRRSRSAVRPPRPCRSSRNWGRTPARCSPSGWAATKPRSTD